MFGGYRLIIKKSLLSFLFLLIYGKVMAHSVQVRYCLSCDGDLRIWVEHWHGDVNPNSTTMTIEVTINGTTTSQTASPAGSLLDTPADSLPGCFGNLTYVAGCPSSTIPGGANDFDDWVYYDYTGLPQNVPLSFTIISGNNMITSDGCNMFPITENFVIAPGPQPDQFVCPGQATNPSAAFAWQNSNPSIGLPPSGTGNIPSFIPTGPPGTIATITMTNACTMLPDTFNYEIIDNPVASFLIDSVACLGDSIIFVDSSVTLSSTDSYFWDFGDGNTDFNAETGHIYTQQGTFEASLLLESGQCYDTDLQQITVHDAPYATIAGDTSVCQGDPDPTVYIIALNGIPPYTFTYQINSGVPQTIAPTGLGDTAVLSIPSLDDSIYVISLINIQDSSPPPCVFTELNESTTVVIEPTPTATINGSANLCIGDPQPVVVLEGSNNNATDPYIFTYYVTGGPYQTVFTTGDTLQIPVSTQFDSTYVFNLAYVQNLSCGQVQPSSVTVDVSPIPTATAIGDVIVCTGDPEPIISFIGADGTPPYTFTYQINGGPGSSIVSIDDTATIQIPTLVDSVYNIYLLNVQDSSPSQCSQSLSDTIIVAVDPTPIASIMGSAEVCVGDTQPQVIIEGSNGASPYTFTYNVNGGINQTVTSVGDTIQIPIPTQTDSTFNYYLLEVQDSSPTGCYQTLSDSIQVQVHSLPEVITDPDFLICEGDSTFLSVQGADSYVWTNNVTEFVYFTPLLSDTYIVTGTDSNGCTDSDTVEISVEQLPQVLFSSDILSGCVGSEITFTSPFLNFSTNYIWSIEGDTIFSNNTLFYTFSSAGTFDVGLEIISENGCDNYSVYNNYIQIHPNPISAFTPSHTYIDRLDTEVFFSNESIGASSYLWDFDYNFETSDLHSPTHAFPNNKSRVFEVELAVMNDFGCTDTTWEKIILNEQLIFYAPNTFTPDHNQHNPEFNIIFYSGYNPYDYQLTIYNRWGEIVFVSYNVSVGWDGTYGNGGEVPQGVYVWKIEFDTHLHDNRQYANGIVNVLR